MSHLIVTTSLGAVLAAWSAPFHRARPPHTPFSRTLSTPSFVAESDDGVDTHGAARGDIAGHEGDEGEQQRCEDKRQRIDWLHAIQKAGHHARESERAGKSDGYACNNDPHPVGHDHFQHADRLRTEGDAQSDFR